MKISDKILLILAVALIAGMAFTFLFGRGSRHGYGHKTGEGQLFCQHIDPAQIELLDNAGSN
jgi:hypothetical protein